MENVKAIKLEAEISADLNTIIKYHPASRIFLEHLPPGQTYRTTIELKGIVETSEQGYVLKDDYKYSNIYERATINIHPRPDLIHESNLLVLVKHLIELEWNYYSSHNIPDEVGNFVLNERARMGELLEELKILYAFLEKDNPRNLQTKLQLRETKSFGDRNKTYDVTGMQVTIANSPDESIAITNLLIANRKAELKELYRLHFPMVDFEDITWDPTWIEETIAQLKQPFRDFRAIWLFGKLVSEKVLDYLKNEMEWNQGSTEITKEQGVIIYTLLSIFHLLDLDEELKFKDDAGKAKYIRSFFRKDIKDLEEKFYEIRKIGFL